MPNSILHKRSSTAGVVPHAALLANGELALNTADGTWFLKKTDGTVLDLRQPLLADGGEQPLSGINPDAQDWQTRVISAGGTVSAATFTAVNNFCNAINNAGLRDRFYRLNLFCGDNLTACLVPLYRGPTLTGTQYGNATDTNFGFVSGDYVETGSTGGLLGASSKWLNTGFRTQDLPGVNAVHIAVWSREANITETRRPIGCFGPTNDSYLIDRRLAVGGGTLARLGGALNFSTGVADTSEQSIIASRTSSTSATLYKNGVSVATQTAALSGVTLSTQEFGVFSADGTGAGGWFPHRLNGYSIGAGLTQAQVTAFHAAWTTFQLALNRAIPQVSNADAQDWITRVYAAGGTVSQSTADAVNTFCTSINSTGLRDRFYRLNLFCGNDLTACRVPLYRGQSLGGTQFGNTTDTNFNFVASDYVERGPTGGLTGNGNLGVQAGSATKHLRTGLQQASIGTSLMHLSTFVFGLNTTATQQQGFVGVRDNFIPANRWWIEYRGSVNTELGGSGAGFGMNAGATGNFFIIASRESNTLLRSYFNGLRYGTDVVTDISSTVKTSTRDFFVAAINVDNDAAEFCNFRLGMYSIGLTLTETQASVFNSIVAAFNNALARS